MLYNNRLDYYHSVAEVVLQILMALVMQLSRSLVFH
jgi:hypothetical protein